VTNHSGISNYNSPLEAELEVLFREIPDIELLMALKTYYAGRKGYTNRVLWRSMLAMTYMGLPSFAALIRALEDNEALRSVCSIERAEDVPSKFAYSHFIKKLHSPKYLLMVKNIMRELTSRCANRFEGFGKIIAIDSTDIAAYSQSRRPSDPHARWSKKKNKHGRDHWWFGYRTQIVADAHWEIPIYCETAPASENDSRSFAPVLRRAGVKPSHVLADAGYDSLENYTFTLNELKAIPIIKINPRRGKRTTERTPHRSKQVIEALNIRDFAGIQRSSTEWANLYAKRTSIERLLSRLKTYRRLNKVTVRRIRKVSLICLLPVIVTQAMAVGNVASPRQCVRLSN
jgi:transposase